MDAPSTAIADPAYATDGWNYLGPEGTGGATSAIVAARDRRDTLYAMTEMGAVFHTVDGGANWTFLSQLPMQHGRLEVSVTDPQTLYAYASAYRDLTNPETGIHRSVNGGRSWAEIGVSSANGVTAAHLYGVNRLRTVPGRPGLLFAATEDAGLLRSDDDGVHWQRVPAADGVPFEKCSELELAPGRDRLHAVCLMQPVLVPVSGLPASRQFRGELADDSHKLKLAVAHSDPDTVYLAATRTSEGHARLITRIYRSTDGGASWETRFQRATANDTVPPPDSSNPFNIALPGAFTRDCQNPAAYTHFEDYALQVDPGNADSLWVAGYEIYRSDDGGRTFGRAGLVTESGASGIVFATGYDGISNQVMYTAGRMGIQRTANARAGLQTYPAVDCSNGFQAPPPAVAWGAMHRGYSAARLVHGSSAGFDWSAWTELDTGMWAHMLGTWDAPRRIGTPGGQIFIHRRWSDGIGARALTSSAQYVYRWSMSSTGTWGFRYYGAPTAMPYSPGIGGTNLGFIYPVRGESTLPQVRAMHRISLDDTRDRLLVATYNGLQTFHIGAEFWERRGPDLPMAAATFMRDGTPFGVTRDGRFVTEYPYASGYWEQRDIYGCLINTNPTCPKPVVDIQELLLDPAGSTRGLYAVGNGYGKSKVFFSLKANGWRSLDRAGQAGGLPHYVGMTSLAIDPHNPNHLFAGTPYGLYRTVDHGCNWAPVPSPFPGTAVTRVTFETDAAGNRRLFAFTFGRGAWVYSVPPAATFADVAPNHWASGFIARLYRAGVTGGCAVDPLIYCPDDQVTRDQMAVFLLRAINGSAYQPPAATGVFTDVPTSHWAAAWVERLRALGITSGCSAEPLQYCPASPVTRDQMAVFLLRAKYGSEYRPPAATGVFEDVSIDHWAAPWIEQLAREGVTGGCSATPKLFCPSTVVTRDQMAVFLVRGFGF